MSMNTFPIESLIAEAAEAFGDRGEFPSELPRQSEGVRQYSTIAQLKDGSEHDYPEVVKDLGRRLSALVPIDENMVFYKPPLPFGSLGVMAASLGPVRLLVSYHSDGGYTRLILDLFARN